MYLYESTTYILYMSVYIIIAPKSWNSLPYDIRCITSISLIKRKLYVYFKSL